MAPGQEQPTGTNRGMLIEKVQAWETHCRATITFMIRSPKAGMVYLPETWRILISADISQVLPLIGKPIRLVYDENPKRERRGQLIAIVDGNEVSFDFQFVRNLRAARLVRVSTRARRQVY